MEIYLVGGAIRDALLGLPVQDRDWVVVGGTTETMAERGFMPVGRDFPVFLHPQTHEEYALARTERKSAPGYRGFVIHAAPDVTLAQDLIRRDLTINAIAHPLDFDERESEGESQFSLNKARFALNPAQLIDPYGGQKDLEAKLLRHVSDAFREDPVRILRVARFAARFPDFAVAPETLQLMRKMVTSGEVDHLVPERVWQELSNGLMTIAPARMFDVLTECGALARMATGLETSEPVMVALTHCVTQRAPLAVRFACLVHALPTQPALAALCVQLRVPTDCKDLAELVWRERAHLFDGQNHTAAQQLALLERCDALRKPQRFAEALLACECIAGGSQSTGSNRLWLLDGLRRAQSVDTAVIAQSAQSRGLSGPQIGELIRVARANAIGSLN
jgi:tRNA nucleotidyltransferase (CCA-adding enzyme)